MENMLRSLADLMIDNAASFGVTGGDILLVMNPQGTADTDAKRKSITLRHLRTEEADDDDLPAGNLESVWDGEIDSFRTVFEILVECRPPAAARDQDYHENEARQLAESVRVFFRGRKNTGRIIDRKAWDKQDTPVEGNGVAVKPRIDSQPRDDDDPGHVLVLTYELHWWAPAPTA